MSHLALKIKDLECSEGQTWFLKVCPFEGKTVIKEVISETIKCHLKMVETLGGDVIQYYNETLTQDDFNKILNTILDAMEVDTSEYGYENPAEWKKAMKVYEEGMLNLAAYLDLLWL